MEPISISPIKVQRLEGLEVGMAAWGLSLNDIVSNVMEKAYARIISAEKCEKINERYTSMEIKGQILQQQLLCSNADPRVLGTCVSISKIFRKSQLFEYSLNFSQKINLL